MSCKTIVTLLLLSCLSATGTALGRPERPPQEEGAIATIIVIPFIITDIRLDVTATDRTLQFCAAVVLPPGSPALNYGGVSPGSPQETVEGTRVVGNDNCANFMMNPSFTLPDVLTRYELFIEDDVNSAWGRSVSTFAMTAKTTLLPCGPAESFTKVTWGAPTPIVYEECIAEDSALGAEAVCYHSGDVWAADFCFDITDEDGATINICISGLTSSSTTPGAVSTKYLYYGPDAITNGPGTATLSLATGAGSPTYLRAIVRFAEDPDPVVSGPGAPKVYDCPNNECVFDLYTRKSAKYEVCIYTMYDNTQVEETATTTFTDMKLNVFDGGSQKSTLMEFVFANGLDDRKYSASYSLVEPAAGALGVAQPNPVNVDCTAVAADHACFGFLDTGVDTGIAYLAVSDQTGMNTIVTPYLIP